MFPLLKADIERNLRDYLPCGLLKRVVLCLTLNSIHAIVLIRFQQWCTANHFPSIFASKILFWFFKIEVGKNVRIGPGLRLPHPMDIIIAPNSEIGSDCDLYAGVRLVLSHGNKQGPKLGSHVFMGDGAKAVGAVTIGDHAIIGVSAVVTKDIPANATAVGIPAKVISLDNQRRSEAP
ncbi:MAG: serine O-acetyltransferase [Luteolibacter sp.]